MCSRNTLKKNAVSNCNSSELQKIADSIIQKKGFDLNLLDRYLDETKEYYLVKYSLKDSQSLGGGAEIKFSKKNCNVISKKFYQ